MRDPPCNPPPYNSICYFATYTDHIRHPVRWGLRTKQDFVLGTSTKGNKRASKYGGKYEKGAVFKWNGCETVSQSVYYTPISI